MSEIAELLGWSSSRVSVYAAAKWAGMPEPVAHLRRGKIWLRSEILAWARERGWLRDESPPASPSPLDGKGEKISAGGLTRVKRSAYDEDASVERMQRGRCSG